MKIRGGRHIWYLILALILTGISGAYISSRGPIDGDGNLDRLAVLTVIGLISLTVLAAGRFLTQFFWSRRRAAWVGTFAGFASVQVLTLSSLRMMKGITLVLLIIFNLILFWYMIRLVQD